MASIELSTCINVVLFSTNSGKDDHLLAMPIAGSKTTVGTPITDERHTDVEETPMTRSRVVIVSKRLSGSAATGLTGNDRRVG